MPADLTAARAILAATAPDYTRKQRILAGLLILARYEDDLLISCERDQLYVGNFARLATSMTGEELAEMARFGWCENGGDWFHYA